LFKVGVIGLGYVGLPLAAESGKHYDTVGFDINHGRVDELRSGHDHTLEVSTQELAAAKKLSFTTDISDLASCNLFLVTVPTPIDDHKNPDLGPLKHASEALGSILKQGDIVVYESTVFPGCTEEICVPILASVSGLAYNEDFFCGYSPERINPGDKVHRLTSIKKVTSGSTPEIADKVDEYYDSIIEAGTYKASSIAVAEAAKVIENAQRDINIAFVNELAHIFQKLGIDTQEVLAAAQTKWNFLPFQPGLVGGHCIGVDPYYLAYKAEAMGYSPRVILAGRKVNDGMGAYVAQQVIKKLSYNHLMSESTHVLILGYTFKENCPDLRNTRVADIHDELIQYGVTVDVYDPHASGEEIKKLYGIECLGELEVTEHYDAIVLAVAHDIFKELDWDRISKQTPIIFDVKGILPKNKSIIRL
jgi:UDP-N-acetyl-D-galactosamine dehydrogenase